MCTPVFVAAAFAADAQFLVGGVALHLLVLRVRVGAAGAAPWADRHHMVGQHVASTRSAHGQRMVSTRTAHGCCRTLNTVATNLRPRAQPE